MYMSMSTASVWIVAFCGALALPRTSTAAAPPAAPDGTVGAQKPATAGNTEIDSAGKFGTATTLDPAAPTDATEFEISSGGLLSTGNARMGSVTAASRLRIKRKRHQFSAMFAGNYGRAAAADAPVKTTVSNIQGRLRYDYFLHERVSLFAMATARHDKFQGLQARVNADVGAAFYLLSDARNRLWTEVGYDFQFDRFLLDATYLKDAMGKVVLDDMGDPTIAIDRQRYNHAVRLFGGYANNINDKVTFATGVEYLQSVQYARRWRINWDTSITATLVNRLAIALTFTARLDNDPAPGIKKVDTITAASLIYRFF
jgi:putative salt-induced outer membrane protein YdiY